MIAEIQTLRSTSAEESTFASAAATAFRSLSDNSRGTEATNAAWSKARSTMI